MPQLASEWQLTELHVPPPQVPVPQLALEVQASWLHVMEVQVPPPQSPLAVHVHFPLRQSLPVPQSLSCVHELAVHNPVTVLAQANPLLGQSALLRHCSLHWPTTPDLAPLQVAVKPQSTSARH